MTVSISPSSMLAISRSLRCCPDFQERDLPVVAADALVLEAIRVEEH
jgi:hypothetical protein